MNEIKEIKLDQTNWIEITIVDANKSPIHCESFGDSVDYQELLRQRCNEFGIKLNKEQISILQEQINNRYIPTEEEIAKQKKELEDYRIEQIKAKAKEIITSKYSIIWQLNHPRSFDEYIKDYEWIDNIRKISNEAEANNLELDEIDWGL